MRDNSLCTPVHRGFNINVNYVSIDLTISTPLLGNVAEWPDQFVSFPICLQDCSNDNQDTFLSLYHASAHRALKFSFDSVVFCVEHFHISALLVCSNSICFGNVESTKFIQYLVHKCNFLDGSFNGLIDFSIFSLLGHGSSYEFLLSASALY